MNPEAAHQCPSLRLPAAFTADPHTEQVLATGFAIATWTIVEPDECKPRENWKPWW